MHTPNLFPLSPATQPAPQPIQLALALALRLQTVFPQMRQSATLLVEWLGAQIGLHQTWSTEVTSLAASLQAERALITKCLANDPYRSRRHIERALDKIYRAQLAHAAQLAPRKSP